MRVESVKKRGHGRCKRGNPAKAPAKRGLPAAGRPALAVENYAKRSPKQTHALAARSAIKAVTADGPSYDVASLGLLLAPFLIIAVSLSANQSMRSLPRLSDMVTAAATPQAKLPSPPVVATAPPAVPLPASVRPTSASSDVQVPRPWSTAHLPALEAPALPAAPAATSLAGPQPTAPTINTDWNWTAAPLPALPPLPRFAALDTARLPPPVVATPSQHPQERPLGAAEPKLMPMTPVRPRPELCEIAPERPATPAMAAATRQDRSVAPDAFGRALSHAALAQQSELVIYNPRYTRIAYPMGDVASMFGVCTDVVIRAYREMGIDLQELVQTTRVGRGDPHIDHRRVDTLRRLFERMGAGIAITDFPEDYQPGDVVTYYRPQNRTSTSHIAIVTDQIAPSGRPMILHNRGWGPQLEDALFVDKITGHYRYTGPKVSTAALAEPAPTRSADASGHRAGKPIRRR